MKLIYKQMTEQEQREAFSKWYGKICTLEEYLKAAMQICRNEPKQIEFVEIYGVDFHNRVYASSAEDKGSCVRLTLEQIKQAYELVKGEV